MPSGICQDCGSDRLEKEVILGNKTGDYKCMNCGNIDMPEAFRKFTYLSDKDEIITGDKIYIDNPMREVVIEKIEGSMIYYENGNSRTLNSCYKKIR